MIVGRESIDLIGVVEYNFSCSCGWWGILRISAQRETVKCIKCGQLYFQTHHETEGDDTYALDITVN